MQLRRYNKARPSVRIWPVKGSDEDEIWKNTGIFLHTNLKISMDDVDQTKIEEIRRMRTPNNGRIKQEVLVVFIDSEVRDTVASHARNLANQISKEGLPLAGLRMDIPPHLMNTFKLLENHGHELRNGHGEDFKCHIRFDDEAKSLYLNVKIPNESTWTRVEPALARSYADSAESQAAKFDKLCPIPSNRQGSFAAPPPTRIGQSYRRPRQMLGPHQCSFYTLTIWP